jgi:hypothetical protein
VVYTSNPGSDDDDDDDSGSSSSTKSNAATAIEAGQTWGLTIVLGAVFAGFAML